MSKTTRFLCLPALTLLLLSATSWAQSPAVREQIAKAYGFDSFGQIERIRYTFNISGPFTLSRTWIWEPKTNQVSYESKDKDGKPVKVTYLRSQVASQPAVVKEQIDPGFINDQYWLLFPMHLIWDSGAKVEETGTSKLPLAKGSARRVVVTYPSDGGYTPGDVWELFVGADNRIKEWAYHRGGSPKPGGVWAWEQYKKAGPMLFSLDHHGTQFALPPDWKPLPAGKPIRIFFSDVAVQMAGSSTWVSAQ